MTKPRALQYFLIRTSHTGAGFTHISNKILSKDSTYMSSTIDWYCDKAYCPGYTHTSLRLNT